MTARPDSTDPLWAPSPDSVASTNLHSFHQWLERERGLRFGDYESLRAWSVTDLEGFWSAVWEFFELDAGPAYRSVVDSDAMPGAQWFAGAEVNFAEHVLSVGAPDDVAIISATEEGPLVEVSRADLRRQVASLAATLSRLGVRSGDRVVGYLPNAVETVVAFLASASLGAVWSGVGQDYASSSVLDRFAQLEPKVLVTADGYTYGGKTHDRSDQVAAVRAGLPTLAHTIVVPRLRPGASFPAGALSWADATAGRAELEPARVPFAHPLWVLFSSGTTGLPKGLVHGHGGVLVEQLKLLALHLDLKRQDRFFWYTSPSWVMWNLQVSGLLTGAAIVTYDGAPTYPDAGALWRVVEDARVTAFGTSPGYLQATRDAGIRPAARFGLADLRMLGSTGSPLAPALHRWADEELGKIPVYSMSGGTDIATAFCGGAPTVPVWPGELSVRNLGVAMESWSDQGHPVWDEVGELVVTRPMPSMPIEFWDDPRGAKYRAAYFSTFSGVWRHGDWITVTGRGTVVIHGRSDATLNRHGIRMGSADIYNAVEPLPEVVESLVIGSEQPDGSYWMPLFVVLAEGRSLDEELRERIADAIRSKASPRHVPDEIIAVRGLPHTRTGKKLEVPIKRLLQGAAPESVIQPGAIDDPALLQPFVELAERRRGESPQGGRDAAGG